MNNHPPLTAYGVPIADVFAEWQRQWQEDPESFRTKDEAFAVAPAEYGPSAERTFMRIASELYEARQP